MNKQDQGWLQDFKSCIKSKIKQSKMSHLCIFWPLTRQPALRCRGLHSENLGPGPGPALSTEPHVRHRPARGPGHWVCLNSSSQKPWLWRCEQNQILKSCVTLEKSFHFSGLSLVLFCGTLGRGSIPKNGTSLCPT